MFKICFESQRPDCSRFAQKLSYTSQNNQHGYFSGKKLQRKRREDASCLVGSSRGCGLRGRRRGDCARDPCQRNRRRHPAGFGQNDSLGRQTGEVVRAHLGSLTERHRDARDPEVADSGSKAKDRSLEEENWGTQASHWTEGRRDRESQPAGCSQSRERQKWAKHRRVVSQKSQRVRRCRCVDWFVRKFAINWRVEWGKDEARLSAIQKQRSGKTIARRNKKSRIIKERLEEKESAVGKVVCGASPISFISNEDLQERDWVFSKSWESFSAAWRLNQAIYCPKIRLLWGLTRFCLCYKRRHWRNDEQVYRRDFIWRKLD